MRRPSVIAAALAVVIARCQSGTATLEPAAACARFDLDAVRDSIRAVSGWTATARGALLRGEVVTFEEARTVRFIAPDKMFIESGGDGVVVTREWYIGDRAWLPKSPGQPDRHGIPFRGDETRAFAMPLVDAHFPG